MGGAVQLTPMIAVSAFALGYSLGWVLMKRISQGGFRRARVATRVRAAARWFIVGHEPAEERRTAA
ncbi:MAG: hypothetical protein ACRDKW_16580 [Actinomycetota bacterium]